MQTLQHSALKHSISRCLRRLASPAKQSTITAERYKSLHKTLSPVTFRKSSRCGPYVAEHTKRYQNCFLTPKRYNVRQVPPSFLYGRTPPGGYASFKNNYFWNHSFIRRENCECFRLYTNLNAFVSQF